MGSFDKCLTWACLLLFWAASFCGGEELVVGLKHRGFKDMKKTPLSSIEMLKMSSNRSSVRFHNLRSKKKNHHHGLNKRNGKHGGVGFSFPLSPGSDYIMTLKIGTPPQELQVFMDTGSDLVWVPCSSTSSSLSTFECILCDEKPSEIPALFTKDSHSIKQVECSSQGCSAIHNSNNNNDVCTMAGCPFDILEMDPCMRLCPPFYYAYGDGSLRGKLMSDKLTVGHHQQVMSNFSFGCAGITLGEAIGVAGFGRGYLSLPSQLGLGGRSKSFSYCLVSHKFDDNLHVSSPLLVGHNAIPTQQRGLESLLQYTPMIGNVKYPSFYYLGLEGISIGKRMLRLPSSLTTIDKDGNGGLIIDSGTTFSMLPESLYQDVVRSLKSEIKYTRSIEYQEALGLDFCYNIPTSEESHVLPSFTFHFLGNATIAVSPENYMFLMSDASQSAMAVSCFIIMSSGKDVYGPAAVLGNYQQQNLHVVYDLEKQRIGFEPKACSPTSK